jgi:hypothetical protein
MTVEHCGLMPSIHLHARRLLRHKCGDGQPDHYDFQGHLVINGQEYRLRGWSCPSVTGGRFLKVRANKAKGRA